jgi:hypothetical protein
VELDQLAAPPFGNEQEWEGRGPRAKDGKALVIKEWQSEITCSMVWIMVWGNEIVRGVGSPGLPHCVTGTEGVVICLRAEVHRVVGVKCMARGGSDRVDK